MYFKLVGVLGMLHLITTIEMLEATCISERLSFLPSLLAGTYKTTHSHMYVRRHVAMRRTHNQLVHVHRHHIAYKLSKVNAGPAVFTWRAVRGTYGVFVYLWHCALKNDVEIPRRKEGTITKMIHNCSLPFFLGYVSRQ